MKTLDDEFLKKLKEITKLSKKVNWNDKTKLFEMIKSHSSEIEELYNKNDSHFAVETCDLIVLCYELLISENKNIDETMEKCLPRFYKKLSGKNKTQSAGGVVVNKGKVLIVSQHGNSWSLPKGHIEMGEDKIEAAKREIYEESGISELEFVKDLGSYKRHKIGKQGGEDKSELKEIFMFLFKTNQTELKPLDKENPEARWAEPKDAAMMLTHPKDREFFLRVIKNISL